MFWETCAIYLVFVHFSEVQVCNVLRDIEVTVGQFDARDWNPAEKAATAGNRGRAEAMRKAYRAATYTEWLTAEIQEAIDDLRPSLSHDDVMEVDIAARQSR